MSGQRGIQEFGLVEVDSPTGRILVKDMTADIESQQMAGRA